MVRKIITIATAFGGMAMLAIITQVRAGGAEVGFPKDYQQGVRYLSRDFANEKEFREFYVTPAAMAAARRGEALPSGTVITLVRYDVQRDGQGNPVKDAQGRFVKKAIKAFRVMEKRTGWGEEHPADLRNGEWEYGAFQPDGQMERVDLDNCLRCHKNGDATNFMFTANELKAAAK